MAPSTGAVLCVVICGPLFPQAASAGEQVPLDVPESISRWFTENGSERVIDFVKEGFSDEEKPDGRVEVTIGRPVPAVTPVSLAYDLERGEVEGATVISRGDLVAHSYCAVATVKGSSTGVLECATVQSGGRVVESESGTLYKPASPDVTEGVDAVAEYPGVGEIGIDLKSQEMVALGEGSRKALGGDRGDETTFLTAVAKYLAELQALQRLDGPDGGGGGGSPFGMSAAEQAERDAQVVEALALPDDQAWHEGEDFETVLARREAAAAASQPSSTSASAVASTPVSPVMRAEGRSVSLRDAAILVGVAVVLVLGSVGILGARRRRRRRRLPVPQPSGPTSGSGTD